MSETYDFLKQCDMFFVSTLKDNRPALRPFGAIMEYKNELYISTGRSKDIVKQLQVNPYIQIVALKPGTRIWLRLNGKVNEVSEVTIKQKMLEACPVLTKRFSSPEDIEFVLYCIKEKTSYICTDTGKKPIDIL